MSDPLLPIHCPHCDHDQVRLFISSLSVLTVKCPQCAHSRFIEVAALSSDTRQQVAKRLEVQLVRIGELQTQIDATRKEAADLREHVNLFQGLMEKLTTQDS